MQKRGTSYSYLTEMKNRINQKAIDIYKKVRGNKLLLARLMPYFTALELLDKAEKKFPHLEILILQYKVKIIRDMERIVNKRDYNIVDVGASLISTGVFAIIKKLFRT